MSVVRKTLEEDFIYFIRELTRIEKEIKRLPIGNISLKKIDGRVYYYQQWREGKQVRSVSLGLKSPIELLGGIKKRKILEKQRKDILDNLHVISKPADTQRITADEIIRIFFQIQKDISGVLIPLENMDQRIGTGKRSFDPFIR